jgi:hypothetical protein
VESAPDAADDGDRLKPLSQSRQDVLGAAIFAFRQPLAQLADERARHTVALEPAEQLLLAGGELHACRYLPTWEGRRFLKKSTLLRLLVFLVDRWGDGTAPRGAPTSASARSPKFA